MTYGSFKFLVLKFNHLYSGEESVFIGLSKILNEVPRICMIHSKCNMSAISKIKKKSKLIAVLIVHKVALTKTCHSYRFYIFNLTAVI